MTQDEIIKLAKQVGFFNLGGNHFDCTGEQIKDLVELVAAKEREACAKLCEEQYEYYGYDHIFAKAIRARGEQHG